jgi:hypothetical protein
MSDNDKTTPIPPIRPDARQHENSADATDVLFPQTTPTYTGAGYATGATGATATSDTHGSERLRPRFGTIFWGVILLVFAAFMVTNAIVPFVLDPSTWIIAGLVAGGVVLVIAGIAAAVRRSD